MMVMYPVSGEVEIFSLFGIIFLYMAVGVGVTFLVALISDYIRGYKQRKNNEKVTKLVSQSKF